MFSDPERNLNVNGNEDEKTLTKKLEIIVIMTALLGILRLLSFDILMMISDLLTALMVYFYCQSKNKCMAIFCLFNGGIGIIFALIKFFPTWTNATNNWFSIYYSLMVLIAIFAIIVYSAICYYSYLGVAKYEMTEFGLGNRQQSTGNTISSNYGAIATNNENKSNFTAFGGKGTVIG